MEELINDIMIKLNIQGGGFIKGQIRDAVNGIEPKDFTEFFRQLSDEDNEFQYKNALDRVEIVSKRFKDKIELPFKEAVKNEAEAISNALVAKSAKCVDYADANRDKFPTDRDLFLNIDFGMMFIPNSGGQPFFEAKELQVIYDLGREWFMAISSLNNFGEVLKAVERSLSKKQVDQNVIAANVRKMIGDKK